MTEREQFEAWAKPRYAKNPHFWLRQIDDGGYSCGMADSAWEAWQAARAQPALAVPPDVVRDAMVEAAYDAVAAALGDAYDCGRVWEAWNYGTMGQDDFSLVSEDSDRVREIAGAAIDAAMTQGEKP